MDTRLVIQRQPTYVVEGHVLGSYHQGDARFGETAGIQCACNALFALCWSLVRRVSIWQTADLDHILAFGDLNYKRLGTRNILTVDDLPGIVEGDGCSFGVELLSLENGEVNCFSTGFPFLRAIHDSCEKSGVGFLIFITGYTVAIVPMGNKFYLFDSHSRNRLGEVVPDGTSVLLKFSRLADIENYMVVVYMQQRNFRHEFFQVQYVTININDQQKHIALSNFLRRRNTNQRQQHRIDNTTDKDRPM